MKIVVTWSVNTIKSYERKITLFKYLDPTNIFYKKQFAFRSGLSNHDLLIGMFKALINFFNINSYTLGDFIDRLKAFITKFCSKIFQVYTVELYLGKLFDCFLSNKI